MTDIQKEKIYLDYRDRVFGYVMSKVAHTQDAENITADVFVKVFEKLNTFDAQKASLSTWIYTIARNTVTDYFRMRKAVFELPQSQASDFSVEDEICSNETLDELADALEALDARERDIIILRYYSGKTLKEIAVHLGISYAYVKVLQNKALAKLKNFLE